MIFPMKLSLVLGIRYLGSKGKTSSRWITLLAVAGIAVGVMVLFVTMAVMTGFQVELQNRILAIESHVVVMRYGGAIENYQRISKLVKNIEGVRTVQPVVYTQGMLRGPKGTSAVVIRGISAAQFAYGQQSFLAPVYKALSGADSKEHHRSREAILVVGKVMAERLGLGKGAAAILLTAGSGSRPGLLPQMHRFKVGGFFETGMYEYDGAMAYMRLADIQRVTDMHGSVSALEVRLDDVYKSPAVSQRILEKLGYQYWVQDWQQMNRNLFSMLRLQKILMYIIMTLIIFVAAFNISSALVMMVIEKRKDIAILKTIGATSSLISRIFIFKGFLVGLGGTAIGISLGGLACLTLAKYQFVHLPGDVYFLTTLPVKISWEDVAMVVVVAVLICLLATIYPARRASSQSPAEALRFG